MKHLIRRDQAMRPDLFVWNGPIPEERLNEWIERRGLNLPEALVELWRETGGGTLFESETILGPFGDVELADDVDSVNAYHKKRGMYPRDLLLHVGVTLTALRQDTQTVVLLDSETYLAHKEYESLRGWYERFLRAEFAPRYGLPRDQASGTSAGL
jgi:hypothetical protein